MRTTVLLVAFLATISAMPIQAQQLNCNSRNTENTLKKMLSEKYGPPAVAGIQAIASGYNGPIAVVDIQDIQTTRTFNNGFGCSATAIVRRVDTGQVINVSTQFTLVNQFDGSGIRIDSSSP